MPKFRLSRGLAATAVACTLLAGCATPTDPDADTIYGTPGRIVAMDAVETRRHTGTIKVPARGLEIPVDAPAVSRTRIYTLRTRAGEELRNRSARSFELGDCVILWHGLRTFAQPGDPFNYMAGVLEPYNNCADSKQD